MVEDERELYHYATILLYHYSAILRYYSTRLGEVVVEDEHELHPALPLLRLVALQRLSHHLHDKNRGAVFFLERSGLSFIEPRLVVL